MAQLIFDGLGGVSLDNQTVQSLLESQGLSSETSSLHHSATLLDEEDLITCGKCKKTFSSVPQFMAHKEEHKLGLAMSRLNAQLTSDQLSRLHSGLDTELTAEQAGRLQGLEAALSEEMSRSQLQRLHAGLDAQLLLPLVDGTDILSFSIAADGTFVSHATTLAVDLESDDELLSVASLEMKPTLGESQPIMELDPDSTEMIDMEPTEEMNELEQMAEPMAGLDEMSQPMGDLLEPADEMDDQGEELKLEELVEADGAEAMPAPAEAPETDNGGRADGVKRRKLECEFCMRTFTKNFDLAQHVRSHTGEKPFQCVVCGRGFAQKSNVKKHMSTHKVWPEGLSRTLPETGEPALARQYVCQYCHNSFDSYYALKTHMKDHRTYKVYKCIQTNCAATFSELDEFLRHSRSHPTKVKYRCHLCNLNFVSLANLGVHQSSHGKPAQTKAYMPTFRCTTCKSRFVSPEALEHHKATSSHSFSCPHCDKWFICERYLRRHLRVHLPTAPHRCPSCGKGFRTEQYLAAHRVVHSDERPHRCATCSASFNRKDKLVRHMLIHRPNKMYKCPFGGSLGCVREFNRKDKLKLHVLTHGAPRPLPCPVCARTFSRAGQLRAHQRTHKPPARCKACAAEIGANGQHSCVKVKEESAEMPTIEIIVMPSSRSSEPSSGLYQVSFPSVHDQEVPV